MKPLVFFDLETTGTNVAKDRIVELGGVKIRPEAEEEFRIRFNPGIPIPEEATAVHGITDDDVKDLDPFAMRARILYDAFFKGSDLGGYNVLNFDIPLLWEEFNRAGIYWDLANVNVLDPCRIYRLKEERTLANAAQFFCNVDFTGEAHDATADAKMARTVLEAQKRFYPDLGAMTPEALSEFCGTRDRVDIAGKIVRNKSGVAVYAFGKAKDVPVVVDRSYGEWMLRSDFSEQTKGVIRRLLNGSLK